MLTKREFQEMKGVRCPYGRETNVGDVRCTNCRLHHIDNDYCSGDTDTVRRHMKNLKLDY